MKLSVVVIVLMLAMAFTHGSLLHNDYVGKALRRYNRHVRDVMADKRDKRKSCQESTECTPPLICRLNVCDQYNSDLGQG
nr:conotoxin precursor Cerm04 [Conus judaeus]